MMAALDDKINGFHDMVNEQTFSIRNLYSRLWKKDQLFKIVTGILDKLGEGKVMMCII